jgi:leucyl aminopeptidase
LPLTVEVTLLPGHGAPRLEAYLTELAGGLSEPPDLIAVGVGAGGGVQSCPALDDLLPASAGQVVEAYGHAGKPGEIAEAAVSIGGRLCRVLFLGLGDQAAAALRTAGAGLGRLAGRGKTVVYAMAAQAPAEDIGMFAEGALLGSYAFSLKSQPAEAGTGKVLVLADGDDDGTRRAVERAAVVAGAVATARDLANAPSAVKSPQWLADEAGRLTAGRDIAVRVWSGSELVAAGFGGILAVGSGSVRPPRLIELSYRPPGARLHVVLVGKGITFDSGGLSLKPNDNMKLMKTDMAGGGAVVAVMSALAGLGVTVRVTGLVAAAENMPSGSAYRPGDVISQYGGRSVEVLNTDAEGRLVLADALGYAAATLAPDRLVDIATLTGAARIALGSTHAALYSTDEVLAAELLAAGQVSGDRLWPMPLADDYRTALDSPVADLAHVARNGEPAGSILAALFLREFTGGLPWAHLDMSGPGWSAPDEGELSKGATGFGTRLLLSWLAAASQAA